MDSIIGNGDRHQENWGIITEYSEVIKLIEKIAKKGAKGFFEKTLFSVLGISSKTKSEETAKLIKEFHLKMPGKFSQIYDSGSCLGREIEDFKIKQFLKDKSMFEGYLRRGVSEIHWGSEKLNHFDLIREIKKVNTETVTAIINRVKVKYNEAHMRRIIEDIDTSLPEEQKEHKLPSERKKFVIKLIALRVETLFKLGE